MAVFELQGPDGKLFEVEAPDAQSAVAAFKKIPQKPVDPMSQGAAKFAQPAMSTAEPKAKPVPLGDAIADVGKSAGIGVAQGAIGMATLPGNVESLARAGINAGAGAMGIEPPVDSDTFLTNYNDLKKRVEGVTGEFYQPQTTVGKYARTVGEFAGGAGALGAVNRGARAINAAVPVARAPTVAGVAVPAVASEAAGQMTEGTALEPWARVAGAMAGTMAPNVGARTVTPNPADPARAQAIQTLEQNGVNALTAGQRTGSERMRWIEDATAMAPGGGARATAMQNQAAEQFTAAALRRAGVNADRATPQAMDQAFTAIGREYQTFAHNLPPTPPHLPTARRIDRAAVRYEGITPDGARVPAVRRIADELTQRISTGGMSGNEYGGIRSALARMQRETRSNPQASGAFREMIETLDAYAVRTAPPNIRRQLANDIRDRNTRYRNLLAIETAVSGAGEGAALGLISPAALRNAVKVQNKREYVRGRHPMSDLARAGSTTLTPLRSSGTAERTFAQNIINGPAALSAAVGGAATSDPLMALASAAIPAAARAATARVIMSGPAQRYLGNQAIPQQIDAFDQRLPALMAQFIASRDD